MISKDLHRFIVSVAALSSQLVIWNGAKLKHNLFDNQKSLMY